MKAIRLLLLSFVLLFVSYGLQAQQHGMNAMRTHMQAVRTFEHNNRQFMYNNLMRQNNTQLVKTSGKYKFVVVTNDGDTVWAKKKQKVEFYKPMTELTIKTQDGERTFKPEETRQILIPYNSDYIRGIQLDSVWVFNTYSTSEVKFYATHPARELGLIGWCRLTGDTIQPISQEVLEPLMEGNKKALKDLHKGKTGHAIYRYVSDNNKAARKKAKEREKAVKEGKMVFAY